MNTLQKNELIKIIESLIGDEDSVELDIVTKTRSGLISRYSYEFRKPRRFLDSQDPDLVGSSEEKTDNPVPTKMVVEKATAPSKERKNAEKAKVSTQSPEEYNANIIARANDLLGGGDYKQAISILQIAVDNDRKNKPLADALYEAKKAKMVAKEMPDSKPLEKIPMPQGKKMQGNPAADVEEPAQPNDEVENF